MKLTKKVIAVFLIMLTLLSVCSVTMPVFAEYEWETGVYIVDESYVQQEMTSKIVSEVSELREEYAKHFVCEDGSYVVATYTEPVHYKENGKWKEIDNSLELTNEVKSSSGKAMYAPKSGAADVSIPQSFSNDQKISATNKGHTISFGVSQEDDVNLDKKATVVSNVEDLSSNKQVDKVALFQKTMTATTASASEKNKITEYNNQVMAVENQSGAIVYEDIFDNADLEYIVTSNSIKENIVVYEKKYDYTYSFDMDFGELIPIVNEDNSIRVVEPETEETVFYIAAPYMYDANKEESTDIEMSLVEEDGIYVLTLKASSDWINVSEREFPVVIDPTVYISYNDVYVMTGVANQYNTKINNELRIGKNITNGTRTYIKPDIPTNIPAGSYINSAYLILQKDYYFQFIGASDIYAYAFDCYKIDSWDPTSITWANQPIDNSKNGYENCDLEFLSSVEASSDREEYPFAITNAVRRWFAGGRNNGIMLASSNESTTTQVDFYSSRASDSSTYPQIYITYTAPNVSISSWETDSQAKESSAFTITTSSNWTVSSNASWISLSTTSGNGVGSSKIIVTENTSVFDRVGTVTVKMGSTVIGTITVTQYGAAPYLTVSPTSLNFDVGSSKRTVNIASNTTWSFSNLPEWVTVTPSEGSMNSTVEVEVSVNNNAAERESNISVTADTVTKTINIAQLNDTEAPAKPDIYEEDGLVYISSRTFNFNEGTETEEHIEYKLGSGEWTDYVDEPLSVIRTYDATIYARVCDKAGNTSEVVSLVLESDLGEYTASYTDIALGEGVLPIGFERKYTSEDGWFFTFEANIAEYRNGYVFTDFYGNKQYFISNSEGKYVSAYGEELKVEEGTLLETDYSYIVPYGELECYFNEDGKLAIVKDNYNTATYSWASNNVYITDAASNTNIVRLSGGKPIYITVSRFDAETNSTLSKNVQYQWTDGVITKFTDADGVEHDYAYTNGLLTANENETITYSTEARVKKITQPNGAFIKYTYNDTAVESEDDANLGTVTVSDSKGATDIWYYEDGVYISNALYGYSDNAVYDPNNISSELTTDTIANVCYIMQEQQEETTDSEVGGETGGTENIGSTETVNEPEYTYDDNGNILTETYTKTVDGAVIIADKYVYTYTDDGKLNTEKYYEADNSNILCLIYEYTYDADENIISELYYTQETENGATVDVISESYIREYSGEYMTCEIYRKRIDGTLINSKKTQYSYNDRDKLVSCSTSQWLVEDWYQTYSEEYTYNGYGNVISQTTTVYTNTENTETNLVETTSNITIVTYEYDPWCQQVKITKNVNGEENTITDVDYDVFGRTVSVTENDETVAYTYDGKGNVLTVTEGEKLTTYTYADNGNLISRTNPNGSVASYSYDTYGNLAGHAFNGYDFTYNTLGSILTANSESGELVNYTYSNTVEQEVLTSNFGNGQSIIYDYNEDGEIIAIKLGEETKYGYEYFETTNENGEVTKEWTELTDYVNSLKKIIEDSKLTINDISGNFIYSVESVYEDEEVEDSFDGVITTIGSDVYTLVTEENKDIFKTNGTIDFTKEYTYTNDDLTQVKTASITTAYSYNADQLISVLENTLNDISQTYSYVYDSDGNITTETLTTSTNESDTTVETVSYVYDDDNQLISAETSSIKYEYTYDDRGNILTKKEYSISLDENNQKVYTLIEANTDTYVYDETWKDKLISYNGQSITYDVVGNPTNYMGNDLTWTMGRQLATFGDISYTYNESGIRTSKTSNGVTTKFYLDGTNIIEQTDETITLYFFYDSTGEVVGFKYNGNNYIYVKNVQGDIVAITDISGNIVTEYSYDPWGKLLSISGNTIIGELNPFRYRSYYYDSDIQLYYLQSRYYDPETGRFINSDDVRYIGSTGTQLSYNSFAYCENNAVNNCDPRGYVGKVQSFLATVHLAINMVIFLSTKSSERSGYIFNQNTGFASKLFYGEKKLSYNGCELIAAYNVLKYLGKYMSIIKVIYYAEMNDWFLFPIVPTGVFGTSPRKMSSLFDEKGLNYKTYANYESEDFKKEIENGKICIATYSNKEKILSTDAIYNFMIHTFAFYYDKKTKKYYVYNGYTASNYSTRAYSAYDSLRAKGRFFLYGYVFY